MEFEERVDELINGLIEIIQYTKREEKRLKEDEQNFRDYKTMSTRLTYI